MAAEQANYLDRIVQHPEILVGKPTVRGTRISAELVLAKLVLAKLAQRPDLNELLADYLRLTVDDVKACLQYARVLVGKKDQAARRRVIAYQAPRQRVV